MLPGAILVAVTFLSASVAEELCQPGWSLFQGSCYFVGELDYDYYGAESTCYSQDGILVEITSKEENDYIKGLLSSKFNSTDQTKVYIGAYLDSAYIYDDDLRWMFYYSWDDLSFDDWVNPDWTPDLIDNYCALMSKDQDWAWVAGDCYESQGMSFVCEKNPMKKECSQGSCYQMIPDRYFFHEGQDACKDLGGIVLEINSEEENNFIKDYLDGAAIPRSKRRVLGNSNIWLGISDDGSVGEFHWASTKEKIDFENWAQGEPNSHFMYAIVAEHCGVLNKEKDWAWQDELCDNLDHAVICESPSSSGVTG